MCVGWGTAVGGFAARRVSGGGLWVATGSVPGAAGVAAKVNGVGACGLASGGLSGVRLTGASGRDGLTAAGRAAEG